MKKLLTALAVLLILFAALVGSMMILSSTLERHPTPAVSNDLLASSRSASNEAIYYAISYTPTNEAGLPVNDPQKQVVLGKKSVQDWITEKWALIALIFSEVVAFLPTKVNGIVQGIFRILDSIFKKL